MKIELNIRLDIRGRRNSLVDCTKRAYETIGALHRLFHDVQCRRHSYQYEDDHTDELHLADSLVVAIDGITYAERHEYREKIYALANALEQDCIALYHPFTGAGELIGSHTGSYGEFDLNKFNRF